MKEKSPIEKKAEEKQINLLSAALREASNAGGHWLNASGKKISAPLSTRRFRQSVQCAVYGVAFGQKRM